VLRGVEKAFANGTLAMRGVDIAIRPGEFLSLLGPSGCGKSTVLRMIAGLAGPSRGEIAWPGGSQPLGFVFQEPTLMPWRTVLGNVRLPLQLAGMTRAESEARASAAIMRVGLAGFERSFPRQLSGGMKMRVAIARALVTAPRLLLLDEPFAALDEITRQRLNEDLLALSRGAGLTVVFVTHSVFESVFLSDRILVMTARPGRVAADIAVAADGARDEGFRTSAAYAATCRTVSAALRAAMGAEELPKEASGERMEAVA
jgi:NitT/TauT family transport system ATP-binding protein